MEHVDVNDQPSDLLTKDVTNVITCGIPNSLVKLIFSNRLIYTSIIPLLAASTQFPKIAVLPGKP